MQTAAFPDGHFGFVTLVHVVEHLDDPVPTLREVLRVLEAGGWIYVEVPSSERDVSDYGIDDHFWFYTVDSLHRLLGCIGFREVKFGEGDFRRAAAQRAVHLRRGSKGLTSGRVPSSV